MALTGKKRIWIFNHYAGEPSVTNGLRHYNFAKYLIKKGYPTTIFAASTIHNSYKNLIKGEESYIESDSQGVPFVYLKARNYQRNGKKRVLNMVDYYRGLFKVTKNFEKPDVIIASSVHPLTLVAGIKIAKRFGIKCICEVRDLWPESFVAYGLISKNNPILKLLYLGEKWIYKQADQLIFTMEGGKNYIIDKGWAKSIDLNKVHHLNNGVDLEIFNYNKTNFILGDEDLKDSQTFKVIYTGSIRKANKMDLIIEVAKSLTESGIKNIKLIIYGDGDSLESLKQQAIKYELSNIAFKGKVEKKYIPFITSMADLNIILGENLPIFNYGVSMNKIFDYLASGKPTLVTFKANYSIIERLGAGLEIEDNSTAKIVESIRYFCNLDSDRYSEYCNNALRGIKEYSFEVLAERLIDIINSGDLVKE